MSKDKKNRSEKKEETSTGKEFSETEEKPLISKPTAVDTKLNKNFFERTRTTIYMLVGFVLVLSLGHFYVSALVFFLIFKMFQ